LRQEKIRLLAFLIALSYYLRFLIGILIFIVCVFVQYLFFYSFTFGSSSAYKMSTKKFITTNTTAVKSTVPCTIGKSSFIIESTARSPIPGQLNMYSIKNCPPNVAASDALSVVTTGFNAFLNVCLNTTTLELRPFAFAVLM